MIAPLTTITILPLDVEKLQEWMDGHIATRGNAEIPRLSRFWDEMEEGTRTIFAAWQDNAFLGHITVQDESFFTPFRRRHIPEIVDLWVQPLYRRMGVARALLLEAEDYARSKGATMIGLGVGITSEFGPAHQLYASFDFKPDGTGVWAQGVPTKNGDKITVDDDALLMWIKEL